MTTTESAPITGTTPSFEREIKYDRTTRDYAMYLDGELIGFERTYHDAEVCLNNLVFELKHGPGAILHYATPVTTPPQLPTKTIQQSAYADTDIAEDLSVLQVRYVALRSAGKLDEAAQLKRQAIDLLHSQFSTV